MRFTGILAALLLSFLCSAQREESGLQHAIPIFRQVTHPFMPPITSESFFFSADGLLWFSTKHGLTSFDGSELIYHSSLQEANEYGLNRINAIAEDKDHNFYIAANKIVFFNRATQKISTIDYVFNDTKKQIGFASANIYIDKKGIVYSGYISYGLLIYNPATGKTDHYNLDASKPDSWASRSLNSVSSFAVDSADDTKLWIGTFNGIYLFDKVKRTFSKNFKVINPLNYLVTSPFTGKDTSMNAENYDIQKMDAADDSTIWFNSWTLGFGKYNTHNGSVKFFFNDNRLKTPERNIGFVIPRFARLSPGKYLLGIYNGKTAIFDTHTEKCIYFNVTENNYSSEETRFVNNDRQGNTWLLQRGLLYVTVPEPLRLQTITIPNLTAFNFLEPEIRGLYFDTATHFFYAAFRNTSGINIYDSNFSFVKTIPSPIVNNFYTYNSTVDNGITKDGSGRFWTAGWNNYVLLPGEREFKLIGKKLPSLSWIDTRGEFIDITTSTKGNVLMRKDGATIYHIDHRTLVVDTIRCPEIKEGGFEIKYAVTWYDEKRNLVYVSKQDEIAQFDLNNRQMKVIPRTSLFGNITHNPGICQSTLDANGNIWFMIPSYGIRIINPETLLCIDSIPYGQKGLMAGDYTSLMKGSGNYLLFHSLNGVVVYDVVRKQSFLFDHSNGLSSPYTKSFLYCHGRLVVSQSSRFEYFKLSNLDKYNSNVRPYLNTIAVDTSLVYIRTGKGEVPPLKLEHDKNSLSFSFSSSEFIFPQRIEYAYQLSPLDNDWHYVNYFDRKITYTKLSPGKYVFRLKAQMQGSNWEQQPVEYIIIITPAWWQTSWFKVLCILVSILLIIYFVQRRIQFVRKTEQQRSKHQQQLLELEAKALRAQMNPHFIFNCLNSIKSLIQQHKEEESVSYLTTFSKLIRTLFNNADKKEISLYDEIETCKYYMQLEAMRFDTKFSYSIRIDNDIDLKSIQVPALIIQPFIENAIWHGIVPGEKGGHVSLTVSKANDGFEISIEDNGIGREASRQNKPDSSLAHQSKGVNLTQSRLELDNLLRQRQAQLVIIDKKNEKSIATGTVVIIKIKEELA